MKADHVSILPLFKSVLEKDHDDTLDQKHLVKSLLQLAGFCDALCNQLWQLEREVRVRLSALANRLDSALLLARARAARMASSTTSINNIRGREEEMRELNAELDQMIRENNQLKKEADQREQQLQQRLGKISSAPPAIVISEHDQIATFIKEDDKAKLQLPELSSIRDRSSQSESGDEDNISQRLMMYKNRALIRELRREVVTARRKHRRTARELVRKDCDVVEAQGQISKLQEELDNQRRECYGHLKAMQLLKARTASPQHLSDSCNNLENKNNQWELKLELSKTRRELLKAQQQISTIKKQVT